MPQVRDNVRYDGWSSYMDVTYLNRLPCEIREVVAQAEATSGLEIAIRGATAEEKAAHFRFDRFVNLKISCNEATIILPGGQVTEQALVHEVLHIKRSWLDHSWELRANMEKLKNIRPQYHHVLHVRDANAGLATETIEHNYWILPEERRLGVYLADHWNRIYSEMFDDVANLQEGRDRASFAVRLFVEVENLTDETLQLKWRNRLKVWGHYEAGATYKEELDGCFPDMRSMLLATMRHQNFEPEFMELCQIDVRNRRYKIERGLKV